MPSKKPEQNAGNETKIFPQVSEKDYVIRRTLMTVYSALYEKGYDPIRQIVGYILSEDPTYITNHNKARSLITKIDRDDLLDSLTRFFFASSDKK